MADQMFLKNGRKIYESTTTDDPQGYKTVIIPYTKQELSQRSSGNCNTAHLQLVRKNNIKTEKTFSGVIPLNK